MTTQWRNQTIPGQVIQIQKVIVSSPISHPEKDTTLQCPRCSSLAGGVRNQQNSSEWGSFDSVFERGDGEDYILYKC